MFYRENPHRLSRDRYRGEVTVSFTACIVQFREPFSNPKVVSEFVAILAATGTKNSCTVPIYCFMPDHLHVILHGKNREADLWRAMSAFKQATGYWFSKASDGYCWQKDFHDRIIRDVAERAAKIRYIANNPVRRGLVELWSDYPFTGAIGADLKHLMADVAVE